MMQIFNKFTNFILTGAYYIFASITSATSAKRQKWKWHATKNNKSHIVPFFSYKKIYHLFVSIFCLYQNVDMFGCHNDYGIK